MNIEWLKPVTVGTMIAKLGVMLFGGLRNERN